MKEILILGALPSSRREEILYESMVSVSRNYAQVVLSPIDNIPLKETETMYTRALQRVESADLIIGDQTRPSTAQGLEIGYSIPLGKPIVVVAENGSKVSVLLTRCPNVRSILYYSSMEDLEAKLSGFLDSFK